MAKDITVEILIDALSHFGIVKAGRHYRALIEDEFRLSLQSGEPFPFTIIHDGSPEWFAKDFRAFESSLTFRKEDENERNIALVLADAREAIESIAAGAPAYLPGKRCRKEEI